MTKSLQIVFIVALATIFSCNHLKKHMGEGEKEPETKTIIADADKIEASHRGPTVAPQYNRGYTITVTPQELIVAIKSYSDVLLTEKRTFSPAKFDKLLLSFKDLKQEPEPNRSDIPVGGSSKAIRFYKDGKEIFHGIDYGRTKNFSGADVDLSYLVPDLQELIAKTKKDTD